ncbi:MAG TPA: hypothetical protein VGM93_15950 [Acidimicrobiales bacterium]|jgi:hypothetical protein
MEALTAAAYVFAHQGGWDEMLFVLVPIGFFVALLRMANKRAEAIQAERLAEHPERPADPTEP